MRIFSSVILAIGLVGGFCQETIFAEQFSPIPLPASTPDQNRISALTAAIEGTADDSPTRAQLLKQRAMQYIRGNQWPEAAADFQSAARVQPDNTIHWMRAAVLLRLAGDETGYEQHMMEMVKRFTDTDSAAHAERTAKLCALPKEPQGEQVTVERLADLGVQSGKGDGASFFPCARALVHYRYGEYDQAIAATRQSDRLNPGRRQHVVYAINRILEAVSQAKRGEINDAYRAMQQGSAALRQRLSNAEWLYGAFSWHDWMICKLLHDEACEVFAMLPPPTPGAATGEGSNPARRQPRSGDNAFNVGLCLLVGILVLLAPLGFVAAFVRRAQSKWKVVNIAMQQVARDHQGTFMKGHGSRSPIVDLYQNGTPLRIDVDATAISTSFIYFQFHFPWPERALRCEIYPHTTTELAARFIGMRDFTIGVTDFDRVFVIKSNERQRVRELLNASVQGQIVALRRLARNGDIYVCVQSGRWLIKVQVSAGDQHHLMRVLQRTVAVVISLHEQALATMSAGIDFVQAANKEMIDEETICQICGEPIISRKVLCRSCKTAHHRDCWEYIGVCSTYGCGNASFQAAK